MFGTGNIGFQNNTVTNAAPPVPVTGANNGLSLAATIAQLGQTVGAFGDPSILLSNREIPMGGFSFAMRNGAARNFLIDPTNNVYRLGNFDAAAGLQMSLDLTQGVFEVGKGIISDPCLYLDTVFKNYALGDDFANGNGCEWIVSDNANNVVGNVRINSANRRGLELIGTPLLEFAIGDVGNNNNGTEMRIFDGVNEIAFKNFANNCIIRMNGVAGFTGTVTPVTSITVDGGIVTAVS